MSDTERLREIEERCSELIAQLAAKDAEIDRLRLDAERMQALRHPDVLYLQASGLSAKQKHVSYLDGKTPCFTDWHPTIDAAIDAWRDVLRERAKREGGGA